MIQIIATIAIACIALGAMALTPEQAKDIGLAAVAGLVGFLTGRATHEK